MANPSKYTQGYDFSGFQDGNPATPLPADRLDTELANISASTEELRDAVMDVRRADGGLQNRIVTRESLSSNLLALTGADTGDWLTGTNYVVGDLATSGGRQYQCIVAHTAGVFATDLAADRWVLTAAESSVDAASSAQDAAVSSAAAAAVVAGFSAFWLSVVAATTAAASWLLLQVLGHLTTRTLIKALAPSTGMAVYLSEAGREGLFRWDGSNLSAKIAPASVTSTSVNSTTEVVTKVAHGLKTGYAVYPTTSVNGLTANTTYYVIYVDADTFKLASTRANAIAGTAFNLTGTTNFTVKWLADDLEGVYLVPSSGYAIDGSQGAWVRACEGQILANWFGAKPDSGTTGCAPAFQAAIDFATSRPYGGTVSASDGPGYYGLSYSLVWRPNVSFDFPASVVLYATASMTAMIATMTDTGDRVERVGIKGGVWDGNMLADRAVWARAFTRIYIADLRIIHCDLYPIQLGNATYNCYEASLRHLFIERRSATAVTTDSTGILIDSYGVSDSHYEDIFITGYQYGMRGPFWVSRITKVHPWFGESLGQMRACFKIEGGGNWLTHTEADFGREGTGADTEGYGYWFTAGPNFMLGASMNYSSVGVASDFDAGVQLDNAAELHATDCVLRGSSLVALSTDFKGSDLTNLYVRGQSNQYITTPKVRVGNYGKRLFRANKDGTAQTGIATTVATKVTFPVEYEDVGALFDTTNSRWTPPKGKVRLTARICITAGMVATNYCRLFIYKNGSAWARHYGMFVDGSNFHSFEITADDLASGTDYYEVYVQAGGTGDKTISGSFADTYFLGVVLD